MSGAIAGAVQAVGATFPSLKIGGAVRPGDSGGGVLDSAGRLVGVVWGCRDGETYLTCGQPLRQFLDRVWQGRPRRAGVSPGRDEPTVDWQAWRDEIESRLAALDAKKQDRGDYLQVGDLNAYAKKSDASTSPQSSTRISNRAIIADRIESLRIAVYDRIEERLGCRPNPGFFSGLSFGKLLVGALGLSGPVALAVIVAGGLAGRRIKAARVLQIRLATRLSIVPDRRRFATAAAADRARIALRARAKGRLRPRPSMGQRASGSQISRRDRSTHDARIADQTTTGRNQQVT